MLVEAAARTESIRGRTASILMVPSLSRVFNGLMEKVSVAFFAAGSAACTPAGMISHKACAAAGWHHPGRPPPHPPALPHLNIVRSPWFY